jgi:hypothetical protein
VQVGYTNYVTLITRNSSEYALLASVYKANRRKQLSEQYDIIGCIGDQVSDCAGTYLHISV